MRLSGKVAIVTGSTRGIGEGIARLFCAEGAKVVITGRDKSKGLSLAGELGQKRPSSSRSCIFVPVDLRVKEDHIRLKEEALSAFGAIDVLVNNAGTSMPQQLEVMTDSAWREIIDIDLNAVFHCSSVIGQQMIKQKKGVIVNVSSIAAYHPFPGGGAYGAAKAGIIIMTKQCAMEWAKYNIRVNSVSPGLIRTPLTERIYEDESVTQARIEMIPLRRIGKPEDVANCVLFLCSEESAYITGQDIMVDGGLTDNVYQGIPGRIASNKG